MNTKKNIAFMLSVSLIASMSLALSGCNPTPPEVTEVYTPKVETSVETTIVTTEETEPPLVLLPEAQERMERCLGLLPGSVSPFGLINDMNLTDSDGAAKEGVSAKELFENGHRVKLFLDSDLRNSERLSFHPCDNTASTVVSNEGFMKFLQLWGGEYEWITVES